MNKEELHQCAEARSDQYNADDLIGGITLDVTIKEVQRGPSKEQKVQLALEETEKFYRPSKTYIRALIACFGDEPSKWVGQRIRLCRNPDTMFGPLKVGGIEVSHASIPQPIVVMLAAKRGKKSQVAIQVIPAKQAPKKPAAPAAKTVPMPPEVSAKGAAMRGEAPARGTISGNALEGDLTGIGPDRPADAELVAKVVKAFAKLGFDIPALEFEYGKAISELMESDIPDLREVLKAKTIEREAAALGTDVSNASNGEI